MADTNSVSVIPDQLDLDSISDVEVMTAEDMDIDLGPLNGGDDMATAIDQSSFTDHIAESNGALSHEPEFPDTIETAPTKVHIRGVDDLTTDDLKSFSQEHFPDAPIGHVEWIDDTSANLVFHSPATALAALTCFTSATRPDISSSQLRPAKPFASHTGSRLYVRIAFGTDRKRPRAYETSRFYLMHPEHDPKARNNRRQDYKRKTYSDEDGRRRKRINVENHLNGSTHDLDGRSTTRNSTLSSPITRSQRDIDSYGRSRDRSASPERRNREPMPRRQRSPPPLSHRSRDHHPFPKQNREKELFPRKNLQSHGKDLFSNKLLASKLREDLFPRKANTSNHRRSDAFDAADETADLFAGRMLVPFTDGTNGEEPLAGRVNMPSQGSYGPQKCAVGIDRKAIPSSDIEENGINIRGGAAQSHIGTIKELFPGKANAGKELFSEKLKGRGGPRTKAEDLFY
ncbi:MAG: hypothetical protein Q9163_006063 [Psora crenata]